MCLALTYPTVLGRITSFFWVLPILEEKDITYLRNAGNVELPSKKHNIPEELQ